MFQPLKEQTWAEREESVLAFWSEHTIFQKSVDNRKDRKLFSFYDGPPFATGLPHYGHLLASIVKDLVARYKTMQGFYVPRRFGWDCHGLPVENEIEKAYSLSGAKAIEDFGVANFNQACRDIVLRYNEEWQKTINRIGRWVDFRDTYKTMDTPFMESVWWVFKELYNQGLVYEGYRVMPYSAKLGTSLSNFEAGENYKEVDDPAITVAFQMNEDTYLLAWTTTPWTLISNLAVTVGPDIEYVEVQDPHTMKHFILAASRLSAYFKHPEELTIRKRFLGKELKGMKYKPLFDYFIGRENAFQVIIDDFVDTEEGTGIVHTAPGFGEADFYAAQKVGISVVCPVDQNGCFTQEIPEYQGRFVKDCDKDIIKALKEKGAIFKQDVLRHRYPFCWRSDTPLIYKALSTWFVAVEKIKDKILAANKEIHWVPEYIKEGRFGKWLEAARDWNISRNRYWGTPIPLWRADDGEIIVLGSREELEQYTGYTEDDLHRDKIDHLVIERNGKVFKRIPEVFDCWFESGSMPYAQSHYPFENKEAFEKSFPADFIAEGLDQTRGWFYTLTVLSSALFNKPAFKNAVVNGIILAEDGNKMSKRLKNYPDPELMLNKYGADAVRLYILNSPATKAEDLCFAQAGVEVVLRQFLLPLWNSYSFFITYARIYNFVPEDPEKIFRPKAAIDQWILTKLQRLIKEVQVAMDGYVLRQAVGPFVHFIEELTNWYIRRSRRRFWEDEATKDRQEAFQTLYTVLIELAKVGAPFLPFLSEVIFQNLRREQDPLSVHLTDYPKYIEEERNVHLEEVMEYTQKAVSLGHALRKNNMLKVRQPLRAVYISSPQNIIDLLEEQKALIAEELNVQEVHLSSNEAEFVERTVKPNFRVLGKKLQKKMKEAAVLIERFSQEELQKLLRNEAVAIVIEDVSYMITQEDVIIERTIAEGVVAANSEEITVALDTELDDTLRALGIVREIVNKVNTLRKEEGLAVTDRIWLTMDVDPFIEKIYLEYEGTINAEILATKVNFEKDIEGHPADLNGYNAVMKIAKDTSFIYGK